MRQITLTKDASWTNYNYPRVTMPAGTILTIISWRPEGFNCQTEDGKHFFLFVHDMSEEAKAMHRNY